MAKQPQVKQPQLNVDLKSTTAILNSEGKNVFVSGVILRKISKFVAGTDDDAILPIPVFYDPSTGKILKEGLPKELREELKDECL
tara:strand:- start:661 stop:915 length:255 start_codon:yes stop_codon:yes gene_type:complete